MTPPRLDASAVRRLRDRWPLLASIALVAGCTTTTRVEATGGSHPARDGDCEIAFFKDAKPSPPFETLGKIESHIAKNFLFGGKAKLEDEGYRELRAKACGLGGNAVVIDDHIETAASEMTHLHVWATVIKLPGKT